MKVQLLLLALTSTCVTIAIGGKFDLKDDLTLHIEINIIGFGIIASTLIAMLYIGSSQGKMESSPPATLETSKVVTPEAPKSPQPTVLQPSPAVAAEETKPLDEENQGNSLTELSEKPSYPVQSILKYRKSSLRSEDSMDTGRNDSSHDDDDSQESSPMKRSMSLPQMNKEEQESLKMSRKVSFNEKNNTVHRYRKNNRLEKRNYETGEKELKKQKKSVAKENEEGGGAKRKTKARKGKGLQHEKQNSKNRYYHCTMDDADLHTDSVEPEDERVFDSQTESQG